MEEKVGFEGKKIQERIASSTLSTQYSGEGLSAAYKMPAHECGYDGRIDFGLRETQEWSRLDYTLPDPVELLQKLDMLREQIARSCVIPGLWPERKPMSSRLGAHSMPKRNSYDSRLMEGEAAWRAPSSYRCSYQMSRRYHDQQARRLPEHRFDEYSARRCRSISIRDPIEPCMHCYSRQMPLMEEVYRPIPPEDSQLFLSDRSTLLGSDVYSQTGVSSSSNSRGSRFIRASSLFRKRVDRPCRSIHGAAPFTICTSCFVLLQLPSELYLRGQLLKLRCGSCLRVIPFQLEGKRLISQELSASATAARPVESFTDQISRESHQGSNDLDHVDLPQNNQSCEKLLSSASHEMEKQELRLTESHGESPKNISAFSSKSREDDNGDHFVNKRTETSLADVPFDAKVDRLGSEENSADIHSLLETDIAVESISKSFRSENETESVLEQHSFEEAQPEDNEVQKIDPSGCPEMLPIKDVDVAAVSDDGLENEVSECKTETYGDYCKNLLVRDVPEVRDSSAEKADSVDTNGCHHKISAEAVEITRETEIVPKDQECIYGNEVQRTDGIGSSFNDYSNSSVSQGSSEAGLDDCRSTISRSSDSFAAGRVKKSFKDFLFQPSDKPRVSVNGHYISERSLKKAEKKAGPIEPGNYWYDHRAGFWGVMGHECLGIIPPYIREFSYPIRRNCAGGNTGVTVNGRELHKKDLDLLVGRGLPSGSGKSYTIDISGRVIDEESHKELRNLGKLAPSIEKLKRGFGMFVPQELM